MSLFADPIVHAANPPTTWVVRKASARCWQLTVIRGDGVDVIDTFTTRRAAEEARTTGSAARLYADEARWYAGENIRGWKPYAEVRGA